MRRLFAKHAALDDRAAAAARSPPSVDLDGEIGRLRRDEGGAEFRRAASRYSS
jgi:hypothetical protein